MNRFRLAKNLKKKSRLKLPTLIQSWLHLESLKSMRMAHQSLSLDKGFITLISANAQVVQVFIFD